MEVRFAMFDTDQRGQEEKALGRVRQRLLTRFSDRRPAEVEGVVNQVTDRFNGARVRDYVPVLVERISRDELNHRFAVHG
jgi:hypothetical protein